MPGGGEAQRFNLVLWVGAIILYANLNVATRNVISEALQATNVQIAFQGAKVGEPLEVSLILDRKQAKSYLQRRPLCK